MPGYSLLRESSWRRPTDVCKLQISVRALTLRRREEGSMMSSFVEWLQVSRSVLIVEISVSRPSSDISCTKATASADDINKIGSQWICHWEPCEVMVFDTFTSASLHIRALQCTMNYRHERSPVEVIGETELRLDADVVPAMCLDPEPTFQLSGGGWENIGCVQLAVQILPERAAPGAPPHGLAEFVRTHLIWKLREFIGHSAAVCACAIFPQEDRLVTVSADKTGAVWDLQTGARLIALLGHTDEVWGCAVLSSGDQIVTASIDKTAVIWDAISGQRQHVLAGHSGWVHDCAAFPLDLRVLTVSADNTAVIWDVPTGAAKVTFRGHSDGVCGCAVFPCGTKALTTSVDKLAMIWDATDGKSLHTLLGHTEWVRGCAVFPNGNRVMTVSGDQTGIIWDADTGERLRDLVGHSCPVYSCAVFLSGELVVTTSDDKKAIIWDADSGEVVVEISRHTDLVISCAVFASGSKLLTASSDRRAMLFQLGAGCTDRRSRTFNKMFHATHSRSLGDSSIATPSKLDQLISSHPMETVKKV